MVRSVVAPKAVRPPRCRFPPRPSRRGHRRPWVRRVQNDWQFALSLAHGCALLPFGSYQSLGRQERATRANHLREGADLGAPRTANRIAASEPLPGSEPRLAHSSVPPATKRADRRQIRHAHSSSGLSPFRACSVEQKCPGDRSCLGTAFFP